MAASKGGTYVRRPGDDQTWLADRPLQVGLSLRDWIKTRLIDLDVKSIKSIRIEREGEAAIDIKRSDDGTQHELAVMPAGKKLKYVSAVDDVAEAISLIRSSLRRIAAARACALRRVEQHPPRACLPGARPRRRAGEGRVSLARSSRTNDRAAISELRKVCVHQCARARPSVVHACSTPAIRAAHFCPTSSVSVSPELSSAAARGVLALRHRRPVRLGPERSVGTPIIVGVCVLHLAGLLSGAPRCSSPTRHTVRLYHGDTQPEHAGGRCTMPVECFRPRHSLRRDAQDRARRRLPNGIMRAVRHAGPRDVMQRFPE